ncbi:hypothetical protein [Bradyrhizobium sp. CIR3A]|uniref:hypothetical protein n=1 Tax=Bradyrhizobium sp. CIR3A TaxID=2663838 RepID=UPI0016057A0D|nr:hypothetical protein [Bradyrhizobium sp. CIR3A]MBB4258070.1 hypothetical protein [Bradyrhizobium sp. CIR3A]
MTIATTNLPPAAGLAHARNPERASQLRPRFKKTHPATPQAVLPPAPVLQWDDHPLLGNYDAAAAAERSGRPALAAMIRLRQEAADEIQRLLAFLDATDGCDDTEDDPAEPTSARIKALGGYRVRETEDGGDSEPSLGWCRGGASGVDDDRELDLSPLQI